MAAGDADVGYSDDNADACLLLGVESVGVEKTAGDADIGYSDDDADACLLFGVELFGEEL